MDPQQELFTRLKLDLEALGYDVYDGILPPEDTPYPFIYLGEFQQSDITNKSAVFGTVYATIHVWSNTPKNRGTVSKMLLDIKTVCRKATRTQNFTWLVGKITQRIRPDTTVKPPLLQGTISAEFKFS